MGELTQLFINGGDGTISILSAYSKPGQQLHKIRETGVTAVIQIDSFVEKGNTNLHKSLFPDKDYCHIIFKDNGIGFDNQYSEKIFKFSSG